MKVSENDTESFGERKNLVAPMDAVNDMNICGDPWITGVLGRTHEN
jgi:hypothetical protein